MVWLNFHAAFPDVENLLDVKNGQKLLKFYVIQIDLIWKQILFGPIERFEIYSIHLQLTLDLRNHSEHFSHQSDWMLYEFQVFSNLFLDSSFSNLNRSNDFCGVSLSRLPFFCRFHTIHIVNRHGKNEGKLKATANYLLMFSYTTAIGNIFEQPYRKLFTHTCLQCKNQPLL